MKIIRWFLKIFIYVIDTFFQPKLKKWPDEKQKILNEKTKDLNLYQFYACPFCVKVRWAARRMGLNLIIKDAKNDVLAKQRLLTRGGKVQVPCLHIAGEGKDEWLYESKAIINYLSELTK